MIRALAILALLLTLASPAQASCAGGNCFWIGGAGTLNLTSDSAHWATASGGTTCSCEPGATDNLTFDGSSGGGTVTVNIAGGTLTATSLTCGAFTGTLDFQANNNGFTLGPTSVPFNCSGSGTRTLKFGAATYAVSTTAANNTWNMATTTGLTFNAGSSTITVSSTGTGVTAGTFQGGGLTYNNVSFTNSNKAGFIVNGANTFATLTVNSPGAIQFQGAVTQTMTALVASGTASNPIFLESNGLTNQSTISIAAGTQAWTGVGLRGIVGTGGATFTCTNCLDLGANSGITITAPSGGGSAFIGGN